MLLDRLNRARGAYLARTGKEVEWKDLAEAAGLGLSTMTDVTNLNRKVTIADAIAFADYLGVEFAWLAAGRGPMVVAVPVDPPAQVLPNGAQYAPGNALEVTPEIARRADEAASAFAVTGRVALVEDRGQL